MVVPRKQNITLAVDLSVFLKGLEFGFHSSQDFVLFKFVNLCLRELGKFCFDGDLLE